MAKTYFDMGKNLKKPTPLMFSWDKGGVDVSVTYYFCTECFSVFSDRASRIECESHHVVKGPTWQIRDTS